MVRLHLECQFLVFRRAGSTAMRRCCLAGITKPARTDSASIIDGPTATPECLTEAVSETIGRRIGVIVRKPAASAAIPIWGSAFRVKAHPTHADARQTGNARDTTHLESITIRTIPEAAGFVFGAPERHPPAYFDVVTETREEMIPAGLTHVETLQLGC